MGKRKNGGREKKNIPRSLTITSYLPRAEERKEKDSPLSHDRRVTTTQSVSSNNTRK